MTGRADIFGDDFDLSDFTAKKAPPGPSPEAIRQLAEKSGFKSREPAKIPENKAVAETTPAARKTRRERRVYRTGRNEQFFCKARPEDVDEFYAISEKQNWVMGETFERAIAALRRELAGKRG